jgi:UDP-N-acetylmuramoyl-L-alanyl-D-glutamate--2,6-diaminopimelate ligase
VVVAGKGHERYQEVAGEHLDFDDRVVTTELLAARFAGDPEGWVPAAGRRRA